MNANNDNKISQELSAYLDGELSEPDAGRVEKALRKNPELTRELDQLRRTREMLHNLPRTTAPDGFTVRTIAAAKKSKTLRSKKNVSVWFRWSGIAAAVVVAVITVSYLLLVERQTDTDRIVQEQSHSREIGKIARDLKADNTLKPRDAKKKFAEVPPSMAPAVQSVRGESTVRYKTVMRLNAPRSVASRAGSKIVPKSAAGNHYENHELIWTDNIEAEQKNVEKLLVSNGLQIVPESREITESKQMMNRSSSEIYNAAVRCVTGQRGKTVEYLVYATPPQVSEISKELREKVQIHQRVSQLPEKLYERAISANADSRRATPTTKLTPVTVRKSEKTQPDTSGKFQHPAVMVITLRYRPLVKFNATQADAITNLERLNGIPLSQTRNMSAKNPAGRNENPSASGPVKPTLTTTAPTTQPAVK